MSSSENASRRDRSAPAASTARGRRAAGPPSSPPEPQEDTSTQAQQLRASEQRFEKAFHANPTPMAIVRLRDGRYLDINDASLRMLGYSRHEVIGKTGRELAFTPDEVREKVKEALRAGTAARPMEVQVRTKSGAMRDLLQTLEFIELDGEMCLLGSSLDITERKQAEGQLRQSQKFEALGQLAGGIAHDFNNLLTAINGYAGLALGHIEAEHPLYEYLHEILKAGERAAGLTRQLLIYSRKQAFRPKAWNLNLIVAEMDSMVARLIGENVRLITALAPDARAVKVDRGLVEQVVLNLIVNARDAMKDGGELRIATTNVDVHHDNLGKHREVSPGSYVRLSISDTGSGMPPEVQARIFEPFFTTKGEGQGTGLGLSVVYGIVKQSGGSISLDTAVGRGTTFHVYFPIADAKEAAAVVPDPERNPAAHRGHETILLVEDETSVRRFTCDALEAQGYRVVAVSNGAEALQALLAPVHPFDLMITDLVMPTMGGKELAERARALHPHLPVLFVSGYAARGDGGLPFLQKPFGPFELSRKVRELLKTSALAPAPAA
jgi:two-component system, cell cycle sensor histidine kinase and response regulator CckA